MVDEVDELVVGDWLDEIVVLNEEEEELWEDELVDETGVLLLEEETVEVTVLTVL